MNDKINKICSSCKKELDISHFGKDKYGFQGLCSQCKECQRNSRQIRKIVLYERGKKYREEHKEKCKKYNTAWHKEQRNKNPEKYKEQDKLWRSKNKEKSKEQNKQWRINNKEYRDEYNKEWRETNKEARSEYMKKYKQEYSKKYPEKIRAWSRARKARKRNVNEHYTVADEMYTLNLFHYKCIRCGCTEKLHIDHHMPLDLGYALTRNNAVVLCQSCNSSKLAKLPEKFYTKEKLLEIKLLLGVLKLLPPHI